MDKTLTTRKELLGALRYERREYIQSDCRYEVLFSEGDLLGKTQEQIRALHFRRDRDWLRT